MDITMRRPARGFRRIGELSNSRITIHFFSIHNKLFQVVVERRFWGIRLSKKVYSFDKSEDASMFYQRSCIKLLNTAPNKVFIPRTTIL
ncbi:MAG: hypothetical protein LAT76_06560 [Schleiferiaceae bacterium]|nr:hypothetical protein [Schleiferiaceae bacterium]